MPVIVCSISHHTAPHIISQDICTGTHGVRCLQVDVLNRRYEKLTADLGKGEDTGVLETCMAVIWHTALYPLQAGLLQM